MVYQKIHANHGFIYVMKGLWESDLMLIYTLHHSAPLICSAAQGFYECVKKKKRWQQQNPQNSIIMQTTKWMTLKKNSV